MPDSLAHISQSPTSMPKPVSILDCTLRDGAYAIDNQFNAEDTFVITRALEAAGFELIEVGHGLGLGASRNRKHVAAETDERYLEAAVAAAKTSKIGMFFIPGIGNHDDLARAADLGMHFVRIGTNVTEVSKVAAYVEQAKSLGLMTSVNLMKSYAVSPESFGAIAKQAESYGADVVCVVDSAGGMLPDEVRRFVESATAEVSQTTIGFHGHNNLQLAVANSLAAVEAGAGIVDSSIQGMGRSAGNAQTEVLVMVLTKLGYELGCDPMKTLDLGEKVVRSVMSRDQGVDAISVTSGIGKFHSSFLELVRQVASERKLDARELILAVSEREKIHLTRELVEESARGLSPRTIAPTPQSAALPSVESSPNGELQAVIQTLRSTSAKTGKPSLFTISRTRQDDLQSVRFPYVRETASHVVGNLEYSDIEAAKQVLRILDGTIDTILIDSSAGPSEVRELQGVLTKSASVTYSDVDAAICGTAKMANELAGQAATIAVLGFQPRWSALVCSLAEHNHKVLLVDADSGCLPAQSVGSHDMPMVELLVVCSPGVSPEVIKQVRPGGSLLDAGIGSLGATAVEEAQKLGLQIYRLDVRAGLAGEIAASLGTRVLVHEIIGRAEIDGVPVIAGGMLGHRGDVIVDHIAHPTRCIGVADGKGGLQTSNDDAQQRVERALLRNRLPFKTTDQGSTNPNSKRAQ